MDKYIDNFKEGLRSFIQRNKYSQQDVADILGCSSANVNKMLNASNSVTYEGVVKLLLAGMTLEEAFGEDVAAVILASQKDSVVDGEKLSPEQIVLQGLRYLRDNSPAELDSLIQGLKF